jgi:hypothetical protein
MAVPTLRRRIPQLGGGDPDPRSGAPAASPDCFNHPSASDSLAPRRTGSRRQATPNRFAGNAEPPVFSIFFDSSSLSEELAVSTVLCTHVPGRLAPAGDEGAVRRRLPSGHRSLRAGHATFPAGKLTPPYRINDLVEFLRVGCRLAMRFFRQVAAILTHPSIHHRLWPANHPSAELCGTLEAPCGPARCQAQLTELRAA